MLSNLFLIIILFLVVIVLLYYFDQSKLLSEIKTTRPPTPHWINTPIEVTNSNYGDPTVINFDWYCDYSPENTIYNPENISFMLEIMVSETIIHKFFYDKSKIINKDGNIVYYNSDISTTQGFTKGPYILRLSAYVTRMGTHSGVLSQSSTTLTIDDCDAKCGERTCGEGDCGYANECGVCDDTHSCIHGVCNCIPNCDRGCEYDDGCGGTCGCPGDLVCIDNTCQKQPIPAFYNQTNCGDTYSTDIGCPSYDYYSQYQHREMFIDWYYPKNAGLNNFVLTVTHQNGNSSRINLAPSEANPQDTPYPDLSGNIVSQGDNLTYYRKNWTGGDRNETVTTELNISTDGGQFYARGQLFLSKCECNGGCDDTCGYPQYMRLLTQGIRDD